MSTRILRDFPVEVMRGDYRVPFLRDGWNDFAESHNVHIGSSLTFIYKGGNRFDVQILDAVGDEVDAEWALSESEGPPSNGFRLSQGRTRLIPARAPRT